MRAVRIALAILLVAACDRRETLAIRPAAADTDPVAPLRGLEDELRAAQLQPLPPPERTSGANPIDVAAVGDRIVGLLAGDDEVVILDDGGAVIARADAPPGARALAVVGDQVHVAGARSPRLVRYRVRGTALIADGATTFPGAGIAAVAAHPGGALYAADLVDGAVRMRHGGQPAVDIATCRGPARGVAIRGAVGFACVLDHRALIIPVDDAGRPRAAAIAITHDAPLWSIALAADGDDVLVAVGGAEDHPLDRSRGFFGYIDSFATLYRIEAGVATRLAAINLSELGVVTPKWIAVRPDRDGAIIDVAGFGSEGLLSLAVTTAPAARVRVIARQPLPPGTQAVARTDRALLAANPLLDAWIVGGATPRQVAMPARRASEQPAPIRLGELMFFTTLLAPGATSDDAHSRFTCETCHWEGYSDGRVHFTGRDDVHASTRALRGLVQGRPYFSRANDRSLAGMVHAEFGVASRGTGQPSWFTLDATVAPWLAGVTGLPASSGPLEQRAAFMAFLGRFGHETSPLVAGRTGFRDDERRGAAVFRDRCESCHQARLLVDDPSTRVPFTDWERHVMSPEGALTWATDRRWKTGIVPYVHADGARVPALRRLYRKYPYFTNGTAADLGEVIARVRIGAGADDLLHGGDGAGRAPLPADDRAPLLAFLRLL